MADEFSRITDSQVFPVEPEHIERIEHRFLVTSAANEWRGWTKLKSGPACGEVGMRLTIVFALALTVTAQEQRYSSKPGAPDGKSKGATRIKNAIEFTPDGVFLQQAAVDTMRL